MLEHKKSLSPRKKKNFRMWGKNIIQHILYCFFVTHRLFPPLILQHMLKDFFLLFFSLSLSFHLMKSKKHIKSKKKQNDALFPFHCKPTNHSEWGSCVSNDWVLQLVGSLKSNYRSLLQGSFAKETCDLDDIVKSLDSRDMRWLRLVRSFRL